MSTSWIYDLDFPTLPPPSSSPLLLPKTPPFTQPPQAPPQAPLFDESHVNRKNRPGLSPSCRPSSLERRKSGWVRPGQPFGILNGGSPNSLEKMEPLQFIEYLRNFKINKEENVFILPWRKGVMRNCEQSGKFIKPESMANYKHQVPTLFSTFFQLSSCLPLLQSLSLSLVLSSYKPSLIVSSLPFLISFSIF